MATILDRAEKTINLLDASLEANVQGQITVTTDRNFDKVVKVVQLKLLLDIARSLDGMMESLEIIADKD